MEIKVKEVGVIDSKSVQEVEERAARKARRKFK